MAKIIPITEHFQHFLAEMKERFWGDLYGQTQLAWQRFSGAGRYERRRGRRRIYRNGYYELASHQERAVLPRPLLWAVQIGVPLAAILIWHTATARLLSDDDPRERQRWLAGQKPASASNAAAVRLFGTHLLTVRIDLDA